MKAKTILDAEKKDAIDGDLSEMFAWYKDHEAYIKLHNNTRSIVEEILEMIRTKLTEVENAEN